MCRHSALTEKRTNARLNALVGDVREPEILGEEFGERKYSHRRSAASRVPTKCPRQTHPATPEPSRALISGVKIHSHSVGLAWSTDLCRRLCSIGQATRPSSPRSGTGTERMTLKAFARWSSSAPSAFQSGRKVVSVAGSRVGISAPCNARAYHQRPS